MRNRKAKKDANRSTAHGFARFCRSLSAASGVAVKHFTKDQASCDQDFVPENNTVITFSHTEVPQFIDELRRRSPIIKLGEGPDHLAHLLNNPQGILESDVTAIVARYEPRIHRLMTTLIATLNVPSGLERPSFLHWAYKEWNAKTIPSESWAANWTDIANQMRFATAVTKRVDALTILINTVTRDATADIERRYLRSDGVNSEYGVVLRTSYPEKFIESVVANSTKLPLENLLVFELTEELFEVRAVFGMARQISIPNRPDILVFARHPNCLRESQPSIREAV